MQLTTDQITEFESAIQTLIGELEHSLHDFSHTTAAVELDQNRVGRLSRMDAMQGQAMAKAGQARQQQSLIALRAALYRIERGDFGRCEECDDWISIARLEIDPSHTHCVRCAAAKEASDQT